MDLTALNIYDRLDRDISEYYSKGEKRKLIIDFINAYADYTGYDKVQYTYLKSLIDEVYDISGSYIWNVVINNYHTEKIDNKVIVFLRWKIGYNLVS